jgi:large subunit ribosomal protein L29
MSAGVIMTKAVTYREMTEEELRNALDVAGETLFNLKMQQTLGQLENQVRIREVRRDIARIQTILSERKRNTGDA